MYVDFSELGWDNWTVAPPGYDRGVCEGGGGACMCAPTKLGPLAMLYFDTNNTIQLNNFNNMIVQECGCVAPSIS